MAGEDKQSVDATTSTPEGSADQKGKEDKGHPENVSWTEYVGLKEKLTKTETQYKEKVQGLEEQIKNAPSAEEHSNLKKELEELKGKHEEVTGKLKETQEKSLKEKRDNLVKRGLSEEKVNAMSEEALNTAIEVLGTTKPSPDLGSGGGSGGLKGSPIELARQAYGGK